MTQIGRHKKLPIVNYFTVRQLSFEFEGNVGLLAYLEVFLNTLYI